MGVVAVMVAIGGGGDGGVCVCADNVPTYSFTFLCCVCAQMVSREGGAG